MKNESIVRDYYSAWEQKDWNALESLLADGFTFSSPNDDQIDIHAYKERCWPSAHIIDHYDIQTIMEQDDKAFVQYQCWWKDESIIRCAELFDIVHGKINNVDVYWGFYPQEKHLINDEQKQRRWIDLLIQEFNQESESTRHVLKRIPEDQLAWTPHPKSMSLGQLALHVARIPQSLAELLCAPSAEVPTVPLDEAKSTVELLSVFNESITFAKQKLTAWKEGDLWEDWEMTQDGTPIMTLPRIEMIRSTMLNHWIHHRGQLLVYLRLLNVPLPAIYGPSADEDEMA